MVAQPHRTLMSVEDYLTLDRDSVDARYEYIDGYAYMMSGGTLNHSAISINDTSLLRSLLRNRSCRVYNSDARVLLSAMRYVYPDATVSCDERDRGTGDIIHFPRLIIEVLSPGTEAYDRGQKFIYYRSCPTIMEYVLVDTQNQAIDVYRRASANLWTLHLFGPGDQVEFASINISFPIADLYEGIVLPEDTENI
jgi:Uma2 family endonuclease